ncbi:AlpA family phage regulatory protein [Orbus mooreae]
MNTITTPSLQAKAKQCDNTINPYQLVDMKYIKVLTGMTDKWFYALIKQGLFPHPIKLGRSSRWRLVDVENWIVMQIQNKSQR